LLKNSNVKLDITGNDSLEANLALLPPPKLWELMKLELSLSENVAPYEIVT